MRNKTQLTTFLFHLSRWPFEVERKDVREVEQETTKSPPEQQATRTRETTKMSGKRKDTKKEKKSSSSSTTTNERPTQGKGCFDYAEDKDFRLLKFLTRTQEELFWIALIGSLLFLVSYDFRVTESAMGDGTAFLNDRPNEPRLKECREKNGQESYPFFFTTYNTFKRAERFTIQHTVHTLNTTRYNDQQIALITNRFLAPNIWGWNMGQYLMIFDLPGVLLELSFDRLCDFFRFWFVDYDPFVAVSHDTFTIDRFDTGVENWTFLGCSFVSNEIHTWKIVAAEFIANETA